MEHILTAFLVAALCGSVLAWLAALLHERGIRPLRRLPALRRRSVAELALAAVFIGAFVHHGATKGTNGLDRAGGGEADGGQKMSVVAPVPAPGLRAGTPVGSVATTGEVLLRQGAGIGEGGGLSVVTNADWLAFGACEDWFTVSPGPWCFRFGSNLVERLTVFASGEVRATLCDASNRISFLGLPLSIVPAANWHLLPDGRESLFWHTVTPSNSLVFTWENALVNRDANLPVTVRAELFPSGMATLCFDLSGLADASILSNIAAHVWRDGALEDLPLAPEGALPEGGMSVTSAAPPVTNVSTLAEVYARIVDGDTNAYYFVDAAVAKGPARIEVEMEGESTLGGYAIMAEPGETNRLPFLIGPSYAVSSEMAFSHVALVPSELQTQESHPSATNLTDRLLVTRWPVTFGLDEVSSSPFETVYALHVVPGFLNGTVSWSGAPPNGPMRGAPLLRSGGDGCACGCQSYSSNTVSHASSCSCGNCSVSGNYDYEGHRRRFEVDFPGDGGGEPPPPPPDDPPEPDDPPTPPVSVAFEEKVVIFEDEYEDSPGVFVSRRSTKTKLTVTANGGANGGMLSLLVPDGLDMCAGQSGLPGYIAPNETISWEANYEGVAASDRIGGTQVTAILTDFVTLNTADASDSLTVVEVIRTAVATTPAERSRTNLGVGEVVNIAIRPALSLVIVSARCGSVAAQDQQGCWAYLSPHQACNDTLTFAVADDNHTINLSIVEPSGFAVRSIAGFSNAGENVAGAFSADIYYFPLPTNVSFYALDFIEVGMLSDDATGYFTNSFCAAWLDHSQNGAGEWIWLNTFDDNFVDMIVMPTLPEPWDDGGGFTWPVPVAWRFHDEVGVTNVICNHNQRFELDANGTSRIRKMGCLVERATNNFFRAIREN